MRPSIHKNSNAFSLIRLTRAALTHRPKAHGDVRFYCELPAFSQGKIGRDAFQCTGLSALNGLSAECSSKVIPSFLSKEQRTTHTSRFDGAHQTVPAEQKL